MAECTLGIYFAKGGDEYMFKVPPTNTIGEDVRKIFKIVGKKPTYFCRLTIAHIGGQKISQHFSSKKRKILIKEIIAWGDKNLQEEATRKPETPRSLNQSIPSYVGDGI